MPNGTYGGVRGRKTKVGRKLSFSSYSIAVSRCNVGQITLKLTDMNYHDWLYRTRRLMAEVEAAMSEMAGHIETDDALPNLFYSGESDARTIINKMPELRHKLRPAFYFIGDNFPNIPGNPFLVRETATHVNNYKHLRSSFKLLGYRLDGNPDTKAFLFSDKVNWSGLLAYFKELDEDARDILLAYVSPPDGNVCRAELDGVKVAQARRAGAAGTKPFFWSFSGGRRA